MQSKYAKFSDQEIITQILNKKEAGIDALCFRYKHYLLSTIMQKVKQRDFAEIVLQDTLLKIWLRIDSFNPEKGKLITWLLRIASNTSIDILRSKHYKDSLVLINFNDFPSLKETCYSMTKLDHMDVREILIRKLELKYSQVLELLYFEGYTSKEVSKELKIPLGTTL